MKFCIILILLNLSLAVNAQDSFYPKKDIENFLILNPEKMHNFVNGLDIEIYKFETDGTPDDSILVTEFLHDIPLVNKKKFSKFKDLFDGNTLGVFFSRHNSYYDLTKDTLLLSSEADMWTIAHELSHALIDKERHRHGVVVEELSFSMLDNAKEDYEELMNMYRNFGVFLNDHYLERAFDSIEVWTKLTIELLDVYELEEVKIERALRGMYESNKHKALSKSSYDRSPWYSKRNCQVAIDKSQNAQDVVEYFESILDKDSRVFIQEKLDKHKSYLKSAVVRIGNFCRL